MKPLAEHPSFSLLVDEQRQWLFVEWHGRQGTQNLLAACQLLLEQLRRTSCTSILCDSTHDQDGWGKLTHWISHNYFQELAATGVQAVAWVLPINLRARVDVERVVAAIDYPITDVFTDAEAAYSWLSRLPVVARPPAPDDNPNT